MSNIPSVRWRAMDNNGVPISGAKLYTYLEGTTTNKATYTTAALSVAHANPVLTDANGWFPRIFMTPRDSSGDTRYRFIHKDAADNTIWDEDAIDPVTLDGNFLIQQYETAENPMHHGAAGNGSTDDSVAIQAAIDAAVASGRSSAVDLMGRTYRVDSALTLPSGIKIRNGTLSFVLSGETGNYMTATATLGDTVLLGANANIGATTLTGTANLENYAVGDILLLDDAGTANAVLVKLVAVSGLTLTVDYPLEDAYTTANSASVRRVNTIKDVCFDNVHILLRTSVGATAIRLDGCERARIRNCRFYNATAAQEQLTIARSFDTEVSGCEFSQYATFQASSGITINTESRDVRIVGCSFNANSVGIEMTTCRWVQIVACHMAKAAIGITTGVARHVVMTGSYIRGCPTGVVWEGQDIAISGCEITDCATAGITFTPISTYATPADSRRFSLIGSVIDSSTLAIDWTPGSSGFAYTVADITIANNTFRGPTALLFTFDGGGSTYSITDFKVQGNTHLGGTTFFDLSGTALLGANRVVVSDNTVSCSGPAIDIDGAANASVIVANNAIVSAEVTNNIIDVRDCGRAVIANNIVHASASANAAILATDVPHIAINGNSIFGAGFNQGIVCSSSAAPVLCASIHGNSIHGAGDSTAAGIQVTGNDATNLIRLLSISGNTVNSTSEAIGLDGYIEGGCVNGNALIGGAAIASVVTLTGGAASAINNMAITGNAIREGVLGVDGTNFALTILDGNSYFSQSTSPTDATFAAGTNANNGHFIA